MNDSTNLAIRLSTLERTQRRERRLALGTLVGLTALLCLSWQGEHGPVEFDELRAKRIDIVDEEGRRQMVIACAERFPLPVLQGKEWPRSIAPAGIVFYKADGDECGGIGMVQLDDTTKTMMILDYANSEACGIGVVETKGGAYSAGLSLVERMPLDADIAVVGTSGPERVGLSNENGHAQIRLADARGRTRLRLAIAPDGSGGIEFLDQEGKVIDQWP